MSMNAHHCCIVFSPNKESAIYQLDKILKNKMIENKSLIKKTIQFDYVAYYFEDETWVWLNPVLNGVRGYRGHKVFVDMDCTINQLEYVIKPTCNLYCDNIEYFNNNI